MSWPIYVYSIISYPASVMPYYPSYSTRGIVIGGDLYESLLLLLISFVGACSIYGFRMMSLVTWYSPNSVYGVSNLSLLTTAPLILGCRLLSHLAFSLLFYASRSAWSIDSSIVFHLLPFLYPSLPGMLLSGWRRYFCMRYILSFPVSFGVSAQLYQEKSTTSFLLYIPVLLFF